MFSLRKRLVSTFAVAAVVLALFGVIAGVQYRKTLLKAREDVLREDLVRFRAAIKDYPLKHESPPQSIDDLVRSGYLPEVPLDPITGQRDWQVTERDIEQDSQKVKCIVNIHSSSTRIGSDGTPYNQW
jgi:general secretion pathway protein G